MTIGQYLISRLRAFGVEHVFGIPGDYVLGFYEMLTHSKLRVITTCDEQGAGFAADAYARLNGLGAVCVTYCVGGLKVANTTAEAFAEKSPVVVISGAPGMKEREKNPLLHHKVREFDTQKKVFDELTVASTVFGRSADGVSGNRPRASRRAALQAACLYRTAARHAPCARPRASHATRCRMRRAIPTRCAKPWPKPSRC